MKEKVVHLAPDKPAKLDCPECACAGWKHRLRFKRSMSEQWGCVVTRHDVYRCPGCGGKFVATNGREPRLAADWI